MDFNFRHHIIDTDLPNTCYAQTGLAEASRSTIPTV